MHRSHGSTRAHGRHYRSRLPLSPVPSRPTTRKLGETGKRESGCPGLPLGHTVPTSLQAAVADPRLPAYTALQARPCPGPAPASRRGLSRRSVHTGRGSWQGCRAGAGMQQRGEEGKQTSLPTPLRRPSPRRSPRSALLGLGEPSRTHRAGRKGPGTPSTPGPQARVQILN